MSSIFHNESSMPSFAPTPQEKPNFDQDDFDFMIENLPERQKAMMVTASHVATITLESLFELRKTFEGDAHWTYKVDAFLLLFYQILLDIFPSDSREIDQFLSTTIRHSGRDVEIPLRTVRVEIRNHLKEVESGLVTLC